MKYMIAPSLMCMDFLHIGEQIEVLNNHVDLLHFDIMDGHYCKNLSLCPDILKQIRAASRLPIDVHLMVENPDDFVGAVIDGGADYISLHSDTISKSAFRTIQHIKSAGRKVGVVLHPATPLGAIEEYADQIDILTIMTVDIGFAGQKFIDKMLQKIKAAKELKRLLGYSYIIQADGAVNESSIPSLVAAGNECFIVGTSGLFVLDNDLASACQIVKQQIEEAVQVGSQPG